MRALSVRRADHGNMCKPPTILKRKASGSLVDDDTLFRRTNTALRDLTREDRDDA